MATGRKFITRDMMVAARDKGWNISITAKHYGMHRSSIAAACERFGIELATSKFDPQIPSTRSRFWRDVVEAEAPKTRGKPVWSCSPAAIERTLARMARERKAALADKS